MPAVSVAAAAPAFAGSALSPNLTASRAQAPAPTRFAASNIAVVSPPLFDNTTGTAAVSGITMTITSPVVISEYDLQLRFGAPSETKIDRASQGITVTGEGTNTITVSFGLPFNGFLLAAGGTMNMFVRSVFTFAGSIPASLSYTAAATNGGNTGAWTVTL